MKCSTTLFLFLFFSVDLNLFGSSSKKPGTQKPPRTPSRQSFYYSSRKAMLQARKAETRGEDYYDSDFFEDEELDFTGAFCVDQEPTKYTSLVLARSALKQRPLAPLIKKIDFKSLIDEIKTRESPNLRARSFFKFIHTLSEGRLKQKQANLKQLDFLYKQARRARRNYGTKQLDAHNLLANLHFFVTTSQALNIIFQNSPCSTLLQHYEDLDNDFSFQCTSKFKDHLENWLFKSKDPFTIMFYDQGLAPMSYLKPQETLYLCEAFLLALYGDLVNHRREIIQTLYLFIPRAPKAKVFCDPNFFEKPLDDKLSDSLFCEFLDHCIQTLRTQGRSWLTLPFVSLRKKLLKKTREVAESPFVSLRRGNDKESRI